MTSLPDLFDRAAQKETNMQNLINLFALLDWQITTPTPYGWFHLLWWGIVVVSTVLLCLAHRKKPISIRALLLTVSITVILLEIYKQINYAVSYTDGLAFEYVWYIFPWQFCSIPMYAGLLAAVLRKGRIHDALCAFLATYAVFAGLCVMIYPGDVFTSTLGVCIQTMFCHGSMITVGILLFFGMSVTHDYSIGKNIITTLGTIVAMAVIIFIAVLFSSLVMKMAGFIIGIFTEIGNRM